MKVAFVSANRERMPDACIPLGLLCVFTACPAHHEKELWDLCFEPDPHAALRANLERFRPDVVAVGLRNLQNNDYSDSSHNIAYYRALFETIRANSRAIVVVGGSGFSVMPHRLMEVLRPDYGVVGEGEDVFGRLLEYLDARAGGIPDSPAHIPGLLRPGGDGQVVGETSGRAFVDLAVLRPLERDRIDPRYYTEHGIDSVQTKRGCPLRCTYCTYPIIEGRGGRVRPPAAVAAEFRDIAERGLANHVFVVDSVFNLPHSHAAAVCRALIESGNPLPWTCYVNPIGFDLELARLMRAAGCVGIEVGSDSGCDEVLAMLDKGFDTRRIAETHAIAAEAGIRDCHTLILGTPGETREHVLRTLAFFEELQPSAAIFMVWTDDDALLDPEASSERRALREATVALLRERRIDHPRWIIPPLGANFGPGLFAFLRGRGCQGPLWQHIDNAAPFSGFPGRAGGGTVAFRRDRSAAGRAHMTAQTARGDR